MKCLKKNEPFLVCQRKHTPSFLRCVATGLLEEYMLAGSKCLHGPFIV
jgi:hypothetical protein